MKLTNQTYDVLKWVVQTVLPALIVMIGTVGGSLSWTHTELVMVILGAVTTFLGASLGLSSAAYNKEQTYDSE